MGHSFQAVGILVGALKSVFSVPLVSRIHEGVVVSNRDKRTLLDKMIILIESIGLDLPFYFIADAYYASGKTVKKLLKNGNHLITRVKNNAVAYYPATDNKTGPGRKRVYGKSSSSNCSRTRKRCLWPRALFMVKVTGKSGIYLSILSGEQPEQRFGSWWFFIPTGANVS